MLITKSGETGYELHAFFFQRDAYKSVMARLKKRDADITLVTASVGKPGYLSVMYLCPPQGLPRQDSFFVVHVPQAKENAHE